jgi:phosphoglucomutase
LKRLGEIVDLDVIRKANLRACFDPRWDALSEQLKVLCNQVDSYYPQRENFRLTPDVKEKSTEKLRSDPREFCGYKVSAVVSEAGLKLVFDDGW